MSENSISAVTPNFMNSNSMNGVNTNILKNASNALNSSKDVVANVAESSNQSNNLFYYFIIIFLLLALVGINLFIVLGNVTDETIRNAGPFMRFVYRMVGYPVAEILKQSVNVSGEGAKQGIDATTGTFEYTIDTINKLAGVKDNKKEIIKSDNQIKNLNEKKEKQQYCYVGKSNNVNTCATITESDKCLSGRIFNTREQCMNI